MSLMPYLNVFWEGFKGCPKILDEIEGISTGISTREGNEGGGDNLSSGNNWWRCRDLNPGHCGYEPHALTD